MLFSNVTPSPYDLRFGLFGFPVRIAPSFWIVALILGGDTDPASALVWVGAVLVSILVHELGHAFVQRAFGGRSEIVLYSFGGYAAAIGVRAGWWRSVLISLAGPGAGFLLYGLLKLLTWRFGYPPTLAGFQFVASLEHINLWWGVLNLAPIWPLDGGKVARELLVLGMKPSTGIVLSLQLSIACAVALALYRFSVTGTFWSLLLFGMLAVENYQALQRYRQSRGY